MGALETQRFGIAAGIGLALLAASGAASAQSPAPERRIALVSPGAELERAARTALEPWSVQIVVVEEAAPGATAPRNSAAARELALLHGAAAVVWLSEQEQGHAIWVYDLDSDQLLARPLVGALPFDGPTAAAVALSVKTLLRHSATAPAAERYGATPPVALPAVAPNTEAAPPASRPATRSAPAAAHDDAEIEHDGAADSADARSLLDIEVTGGVRIGLTQPSQGETRAGLGAWLFPMAGALGIGLRATIGPAIDVSSAAFEGQLLDAAPGLFARYRWPLPHGFSLGAGAGATAHVTVLDGAIEAQTSVQSVVRLAPSLDLELLADVRVASFLRVGARAGVLFWLRPQRYLLAKQPVLELSRNAFEAGLTATAGLPD